MTPLDPEQKEKAISLAYDGRTMKAIEEELGVTPVKMAFTLSKDSDFEKSFMRARQAGLERQSDDLLTIADDVPDVQKARLKSDNLKWMLSKRLPAVYGDRLDLNVNETVSLTTAIAAARARALPIRDQHTQLESQDVEYIELNADGTSDNKSVAPIEHAKPADPESSPSDAGSVDKGSIFD